MARKKPPVRVRALLQPTFVRFVFEMPDGINVSSVLNDQKLTLQFNSVLTFDLADAKIAAPPNVASINQRADADTSAVDIALIGEVDVHSFREEKNYIVDVAFQQAEKPVVAESHGAVAPQASIAPRGLASAKPMAMARGEHGQAGQGADAAAPAGPQPRLLRRGQRQHDPRPRQRQKRPHQRLKKPRRRLSTPRLRPRTRQLHPKKVTPVADDAAPASEKISAPKETLAPAAAPQKMKPAASEHPPESRASDKSASIEALRDSEGLHVKFSFATATPAALFRRADTVWLVFDQTAPIDIEPIRAKGGAVIGDVSRVPLEKGQAIRIRLNRPRCLRLKAIVVTVQ